MSPRELERQILNDIRPFLQVAAGNDYFEIINYLAHGQPARNNDDAGSSFAFGYPVSGVIGHCAAIMRDHNTLLL
jgi:hypothetical protein